MRSHPTAARISRCGSTPSGARVQGTDGSLYGTTSLGGLNNLGTAFKVTANGTLNILLGGNTADYTNAGAVAVGAQPFREAVS